jgi:predicted nucleic acid-binding protein
MNIPSALQQQILQLIRSRSYSMKPVRTLQVRPDPDDKKFLGCADAAGPDYLLTGKQRRFPKFWKKTKPIKSREFISIVAPHLIP